MNLYVIIQVIKFDVIQFFIKSSSFFQRFSTDTTVILKNILKVILSHSQGCWMKNLQNCLKFQTRLI